MKKLCSILLAMAMLLGCASAFAATHTETGEQVTFTGTQLRVYDVVTYETIAASTFFHGVRVSDALPPDQVIATVGQQLMALLANGTVTKVEFVGLENLFGAETAATLNALPLAERLQKIVELLAALPNFDAATGAFASDSGAELVTYSATAQDTSMASGYGYLISGATRTPFIRITIELTYAPIGQYANLTESQREYYENYMFTYAKHNNASQSAWGLTGISQYAPAFFGK